ncbi:MAG: hypothetical protein Kow0037_12440 [Calditrichia bacterium]
MRLQSNIMQYFERTINTLRKMEKSSEVFNELKNISNELEMLEQYVKTTFQTLDNNFNSFSRQINLLSELVEFQRDVANYKDSDKLMATLFEYLQRNIHFTEGFFAFKLKDDDPDYLIATNQTDRVDQYRQFVNHDHWELLKGIMEEKELALLIGDTFQFRPNEIQWRLLEARSAILMPIKVRGKLLGLGCLINRLEAFKLDELSFVNLNIGVISLLIYQHYYFARLKSRLFKQFRLRKMLEEVKYAEYFEKGPLFVFTLDSRHVVLHANTTALNHLKLSEELIVGENFLELIERPYRQAFAKVLEKAEEEKVSNFLAPLAVDGPHKPVLEFYISRFLLQNHFSLLLVFAVDITETYHKNQLKYRNEMLDEMDQFSRTLVTEFNNLLTIVVPNISLLRTGLMAEHPFQKQLEAMEMAARRSANFIQKFLNYDLEGFESFEEANLNQILRQFVAELDKSKSGKVTIKLQLDPGLKDIVLYPLRFKQLLRILFDNSYQAVQDRDKPEIRFITRAVRHKQDGLLPGTTFYLPEGEYMELAIWDNGAGISDKSIGQIMKPFYSTRIKNEGVGLGLFIAYNIVKDMKGEIFVKSKLNEFTSVHIYLPVKEMTKMEPLAVPQVEEEKPAAKVPTVLVVDDEYNIRSMMKEIMEMNGFKVYTAGNGRDGVDVYQRRQSEIDLVILDMVMPVMDGRAAFIEIKKINPNQKIFIISGYSQREDLDEILRKGAVGFMRKPFQVNEIATKVKEILNIKEE